MEEINRLVSNSLIKYFSILSCIGYCNQEEVNRLIALVGIGMIMNDFSEYVTDEDFKSIMNALHCLEGTCLIGYIDSNGESTLFNKIKVKSKMRVSEDLIIRTSENGKFNIKS